MTMHVADTSAPLYYCVVRRSLIREKIAFRLGSRASTPRSLVVSAICLLTIRLRTFCLHSPEHRAVLCRAYRTNWLSISLVVVLFISCELSPRHAWIIEQQLLSDNIERLKRNTDCSLINLM